MRRGQFRWLAVVALACVAPPVSALEVRVDAPAELAAVAERVRRFDAGPLEGALAAAGLALPARVSVTLVDERDPRARDVPHWVVAGASGVEHIVLFPARIGSYPYDSIESVLNHEVTHLALTAAADGRPLPRWFHEGVAVHVESGWSATSDLRVVLGAIGNPGMADLQRLFESDSHLGSADAYRLAAAVVADMRRRHGSAAPGAIASRVALGAPFGEAFRSVTGETPDEAAESAWAPYRRWTTWISLITSTTALWVGIILLAWAAAIVRLRKRAQRRRLWEDDENDAA